MTSLTRLPAVLASHALRTPRKPAFVLDGKPVLWAECADYAAALGGALTQHVGERPATVLITASDVRQFVRAFFGVVMSGHVAVPLPDRLTPKAAGTLLADCRPDVVLTGTDENRSASAFGATKVIAIDAIERQREGSRENAIEVTTNLGARPDQRLVIAYSSGTTAVPKGVVHTQQTVCHAALNAIAHYGVNENERTLVAAPIYTSRAIFPMLATAYAGGTSIVLGRFTVEDFIGTVGEYSPTTVDLVPTQFSLLLGDPRFSPALLADCRFVLCGGARSDPKLLETLFHRFPTNFVEAYGTTETSLIARMPRRAPPDKRGSVGLPRGVEVALLDDEGRASSGERGEIAVYSPANMVGYLNKAVETSAAFCLEPETGKRFFKTGDYGRIDEDGYLWLVGRKKDMIITAGFNVFPADAERALLQHPLVEDAAVVGRPHPLLGEVSVAFVTVDARRASDTNLAHVLRRWANAKLDSRQKLHEVHVLSDLPRNANGKILKTELREHAQAGGHSRNAIWPVPRTRADELPPC